MSATARRRAGPAAEGLAGAALILAALSAAWAVTPLPAQDAFAARAAALPGPPRGADLTLMLADHLPLPPSWSLWAASWFGAPCLLAAGLLSTPRRLLGAAAGLAACLNPLALSAYASGWGLGAAGAFVLAVQFMRLPGRPPHRGLPPLGAAVTAGAASVPGALSLALPLFAVLFAVVPRPWAAGTMRAAYLCVFLPPAAWIGATAFLGWRAGAAAMTGAMTDAMTAPSAGQVAGQVAGQGGGDGWHLALGLILAAACGPGLVASAKRGGGALLVLAALAFTAPGVPDALGPLLAWSGGAALALSRRAGGDLAWLALGTLGSAGAALLLA